MKNLKITLIAAIGFAGLALAGSVAQAMPISSAPAAAILAGQGEAAVQDVRWVCGPYRCWDQPEYYYQPRPFYGFQNFGYFNYGHRDYDHYRRYEHHRRWDY